jgi:thymidylate synthase ThyX
MMTIEWQSLSPRHGYDVPEAVAAAGLTGRFDDAMARSAALHDALLEQFPASAGYAVSLAYKVRYVMQFNARQAMHLLELRTGPQGHPAYRRVCQEMHRLIDEQAGHHALAAMMRHVDHTEPGLERLEAERRAESRRASSTP